VAITLLLHEFLGANIVPSERVFFVAKLSFLTTIDQGDTHAWARYDYRRSSYHVRRFFHLFIRIGFCFDEKAFL